MKETHPGFSPMETKNTFFEIEKDLNKNKRIRTRFTVQQLEKLEGKILDFTGKRNFTYFTGD